MRRVDKRGVSDIIITIIIVAVSLFAITMVWVVVNNLVKGGTQGASLAAKCLNTEVEVTRVACIDGSVNKLCTVTFSRTGSESIAIGGVKAVFRNDESGKSGSLIDIEGNIEHLVGKVQADIDTGIAIADAPNKVETTVYFKDDSGNEQLCSQSSPFSFVA